MDFPDYKHFWNNKALDAVSAMSAVDGSPDETTLRLTGRFTARQVRAALDPRPTDHLFEIGCGVGRIGREVLPDVAHWTGLDISENMLAVAAGRLGGGDRLSLAPLHGPRLEGLADGSMDKGYCVAVFIHMDKEDFALYLREVARVLRPGGLFYFDHWNLAHPGGWRRYEMELAQALAMPPGVRKDVARNQFTVPEEARLFVERAGLEVVACLGDSPFLQLVARKPGGGVTLAAEQARVAAAAGTLSYGPAWTHYFDLIVQAEQAGTPPQALADELVAAPGADLVVSMFRRWLAGNWQRRSAQWGPVPDALARDLGAADAR
ncbi:MAG: methyltransferase domain-containing protein [Arenimonas sp.]|nr:methyltransferase domain-containing protein [Arenimonas sp.]